MASSSSNSSNRRNRPARLPKEIASAETLQDMPRPRLDDEQDAQSGQPALHESKPATLKSFSVDVSASNPAETRPLELVAARARKSAGLSQPPEEQPQSNNSDLAVNIAPIGNATKRAKPSKKDRLLPVKVSTVICCAFVALLASYTIKRLQESSPPSLTVTSGPAVAFDETELEDTTLEVPLDSSIETESKLAADYADYQTLDDLASLQDEPIDPLLPPSVAELTTPLLSAQTNEASAQQSDLLGDGIPALGEINLGNLQDGQAEERVAELNADAGEQATAKFFGTDVQGKRIVFLVDNSGGMQAGGFETLIRELLETIEALKPSQRFYVVLYSDTAYPLFHPRPATDFVKPTPQVKRQLAAWLDNVELCVGNAIDESLVALNTIRPDSVYLLTDGRVNTTRDGRKLAMMLDASRRDYTIHTFGMGTGETSQAAQQLRQIAEANDGLFRAIEIDEQMKALARLKQRPYHSKQPGTVWGKAVGSR